MITFDKGVYGADAREQRAQIVDDVHIAWAASTQSELVVPVFDKGQNLVVVLDIDSDQPVLFSRRLATQLETLLARLFGPDEAA